MYNEMQNQLRSKTLFEKAKGYAFDYIDNLKNTPVYPSESDLQNLSIFDEDVPQQSTSADEIIELLNNYGSKTTTIHTGGKFFGFVCGSIVPVALATKWMSDTWDQNSGLFVMSPIASKLEAVCEKWIVDLLGLPQDTAAGFVSGSSTAIICALATARNELLLKKNWDVNKQGLFGAPEIKVVVSEQAHSSVFKALSLIGLGKDRVCLISADKQGRMDVTKLPEMDSNTLIIAQAGNVNSGAFDDIEHICRLANKAGSWVHVDGAFGLWAAACENTKYLTKGNELADSWSVDAHKTINAPYDCGIVLCKSRNALIHTMQASGSYIQYSENRDGMLYTPEMSRRARSIELWATLRYLGKSGIDEMVDTLCVNSRYFADKLAENGFTILNDVVFNQILVKCDSSKMTTAVLNKIQKSGEMWCGGATWKGHPVIRLSVCSWHTTKADIDVCIKTFIKCRNEV